MVMMMVVVVMVMAMVMVMVTVVVLVMVGQSYIHTYMHNTYTFRCIHTRGSAATSLNASLNTCSNTNHSQPYNPTN